MIMNSVHFTHYSLEKFDNEDYFYDEIEDCNCVRKIYKKSQTNETVIESQNGRNNVTGYMLHLNILNSIKIG